MSGSNLLVVEAPLLKTKCILGEGPLYDPRTEILHFLDIAMKRLYHYNTGSSTLICDEFDEAITALALREDGEGLACATASGFALIEGEAGLKPSLTYLAQPLSERERQYSRLNDGACDAKGRFLAATLQSTHQGNEFGGTLYQYDPKDRSCKILDDKDITDGNGLGWSEDNKTLFFTSSNANKILAYDYDVEDGSVANRRIFADGTALGLCSYGLPDGLCFDSEGCIWSARWAGSKIFRFNKDGTGIDFEISFPTVFSVTACCFGGPENDQLFVTTAHPSVAGLEDAGHVFEQYPDSGNVFQVDLKGRFSGGKWRYAFGG